MPSTTDGDASPTGTITDQAWMTTTDVVAYSKRSRVTIHRHAAAGTLRSVSGGYGHKRFFRREWVDEWMVRAPRLPEPDPIAKSA